MQAMRDVLSAHKSRIQALYDHLSIPGTYAIDPVSTGRRALKNTLLGYLACSHDADAIKLARQQYAAADNMTDRIGALGALIDTTSAERDSALADFYTRFEKYPLVIDKWFSLQASSIRKTTIDDVTALAKHPAFTLLNPNRVRSLYSAFAMNNPVIFHSTNGSGYNFLRDAILTLNTKNPQIASRLLTPLREWRRYTPDRQEKMKAVLQNIANTPDLSPDVFEVVEKSLK